MSTESVMPSNHLILLPSIFPTIRLFTLGGQNIGAQLQHHSFQRVYINRATVLRMTLEEGMTIHYSILAWRIPWSEEPGGLQSIRSQRVGHDWRDLTHTHIVIYLVISRLLELLESCNKDIEHIIVICVNLTEGWISRSGIAEPKNIYSFKILFEFTCKI